MLRAADLSVDEIGAGVVGGGNDGGIDGVYVFVNDQLLDDDSEIFEEGFSATSLGSGVSLKLVLIQAKHGTSFTETAVDLVRDSTGRLLDLSVSEESQLKLYSAAVVGRFALFRRALEILAIRHPIVEIEFSYATRGDTEAINEKVRTKASGLEAKFAETVSGAAGSVVFLGADELWGLASNTPTYTLQLRYQEHSTVGTSDVALVTLRDYLGFVSTDTGELRRHIFDWNVRDYQGNVEVIREIRASLEDEGAPEFWWLNNGVTVVCSKVSSHGKTYTLDDVQIVNGLQASYTIYETLHQIHPDSILLDKTILVRVLQIEDTEVRDKIIRATNRQTNVPEASLRATDATQREIEDYFLANGWYYDRRKNYYKNLGRSPDRIVSIPLLAQATMAVGLSRPDDSRARPSSLLKADDTYKTIFSEKIALPVYLWAAKTQRKIDAFLRSEDAGLAMAERTNLRFHLAMLATAKIFGSRVYAPAQLVHIAENDADVSDADLPSCLEMLRGLMKQLTDKTGDPPDKVAKGRQFVDAIFMEAKLD